MTDMHEDTEKKRQEEEKVAEEKKRAEEKTMAAEKTKLEEVKKASEKEEVEKRAAKKEKAQSRRRSRGPLARASSRTGGKTFKHKTRPGKELFELKNAEKGKESDYSVTRVRDFWKEIQKRQAEQLKKARVSTIPAKISHIRIVTDEFGKESVKVSFAGGGSFQDAGRNIKMMQEIRRKTPPADKIYLLMMAIKEKGWRAVEGKIPPELRDEVAKACAAAGVSLSAPGKEEEAAKQQQQMAAANGHFASGAFVNSDFNEKGNNKINYSQNFDFSKHHPKNNDPGQETLYNELQNAFASLTPEQEQKLKALGLPNDPALWTEKQYNVATNSLGKAFFGFEGWNNIRKARGLPPISKRRYDQQLQKKAEEQARKQAAIQKSQTPERQAEIAKQQKANEDQFTRVAKALGYSPEKIEELKKMSEKSPEKMAIKRAVPYFNKELRKLSAEEQKKKLEEFLTLSKDEQNKRAQGQSGKGNTSSRKPRTAAPLSPEKRQAKEQQLANLYMKLNGLDEKDYAKAEAWAKQNVDNHQALFAKMGPLNKALNEGTKTPEEVKKALLEIEKGLAGQGQQAPVQAQQPQQAQQEPQAQAPRQISFKCNDTNEAAVIKLGVMKAALQDKDNPDYDVMRKALAGKGINSVEDFYNEKKLNDALNGIGKKAYGFEAFNAIREANGKNALTPQEWEQGNAPKTAHPPQAQQQPQQQGQQQVPQQPQTEERKPEPKAPEQPEAVKEKPAEKEPEPKKMSAAEMLRTKAEKKEQKDEIVLNDQLRRMQSREATAKAPPKKESDRGAQWEKFAKERVKSQGR